MSYGKSGPAQGTTTGGMQAGPGLPANAFMPQPQGGTVDQQPLSNQINNIGMGQQGLVSMLGQNAVPTSTGPGRSITTQTDPASQSLYNSYAQTIFGTPSEAYQPAFSGTQDTAGMAQQFPNLMQNPGFNPQAQLQQQITQARDAGAFAGAGSSNSFPAAPQQLYDQYASQVFGAPAQMPQTYQSAVQGATNLYNQSAPAAQPAPAPAPTLNNRVQQSLAQSQAAKAATVAARAPVVAPKPAPKPVVRAPAKAPVKAPAPVSKR